MKAENIKTYTEFKDAQDILFDIYGDVSGFKIGGFNHRLMGYNEDDFDHNSQSYQMRELCDKLIGEGKIFYVNNFKCKCGSYRFTYGGGWACNNCQNCITAPNWWKIQVQKDGDAYICKGNGFQNLQESDNYAYGRTEQEARDNYMALYI